MSPAVRRLALLGLVAACSGTGGAGGSAEPLPPGACAAYVFAQPSDEGAPGGALTVVGSWDDWAPAGTAMAPHPTRAGWWYAPLALPPGEYGYLVQQGGVSRLDATTTQTTFRGAIEVSRLTVADCHQPDVVIDHAQGDDQGRVQIEGRFVPAADGGALASVEATTAAGALAVSRLDPATGAFTLTGQGLPRGRHAVALTARDGQGRAARALPAAWVQPRSRSWREGLLYQVVVDRFRGPGGAALSPPATPASRAGGTLDGVRAEVERGTFDALGVTGLWLSPAYRNPDQALLNRDGHMSEGYHGYWPLASREVDPKIGGDQALRDLIAAAHGRGLRVLLDVVPNHVFEDNPLRQAHLGDGWFNDTNACVCGASGCDWGTHIQSCWFTPFLPDVRWQQAEAARHQVDDVRWWVDTFGLDGVRVDAVPMMPRAATRRLSQALHRAAAADEQPFVLGEVFTGPGPDGLAQIKYFLGPDSLDSAFDFPLMWALRAAIASDSAGLDTIESTLATSDTALAGSGTVEARIIGNHDVSRFLSAAAGDDGGDPWTSAPPRPTDPRVFARHRLALTLLLTLPGMPVLYYGDELGLPGANDPDCRRVLPSFDALPAEEAASLALARRLGTLRACSAPLRQGERRPLVASRDVYAFERALGDDRVVVVVAKGAGPSQVTLPAGTYRDVLAPGDGDLSGTVTIAPLTGRVLVPTTSGCFLTGFAARPPGEQPLSRRGPRTRPRRWT